MKPANDLRGQIRYAEIEVARLREELVSVGEAVAARVTQLVTLVRLSKPDEHHTDVNDLGHLQGQGDRFDAVVVRYRCALDRLEALRVLAQHSPDLADAGELVATLDRIGNPNKATPKSRAPEELERVRLSARNALALAARDGAG